MADDDLTHFQFDFGGVSLELSGERRFVEEMYQQVMRDVEAARSGRKEAALATKPAGPAQGPGKVEEQAVVWIHRCSEMMRKIYMVPAAELGDTMLAKSLAPERINVLYVDKGAMDVLPTFDHGKTLWAEFTELGKKKFAEAAAATKSKTNAG